MCGHVGIFRTAYATNIGDHRALFKTMLFADYVRGKDSTGVAVMHTTGVKAGSKVENFIFKRAMGSPDFIETHGYDKVEKFTRPIAFMGHNRAATRGSVNNANAHPFEVGKIVLAHNGTLTNKYDLPDQKYFDTDSECIAHLLNEKPIEEVMNLIEGAWALVWWNSEEKTLNFLRNGQRTFYYGLIEKGKTLLYSSTEHLIRWSCEHNKEVLDGETDKRYGDIFPTEVNTLYTFHEGSTEPVMREIEIKPKPKPAYNAGRSWNGKEWAPTKKPQTTTKTPKGGGTNGTTSRQEKLAAGLAKKKSLLETIMHGMLGETVPFKYTSANGYTSKKTKEKCRILNGAVLDDYSSRVFPEFAGCAIRIVSPTKLSFKEIRKSLEGVWLGTVEDFTMAADCTRITVKLGSPSPFPQYDMEADLKFKEAEEEALKKIDMVKGPSGILIPITDFKIMTSTGCTGCGEDLDPALADSIEWIEGDWAVCPQCVAKGRHLHVSKALLVLGQ